MKVDLEVHHDGRTLVVRYATTNDFGAEVFVQHYVDHYPVPKPSCYVLHVAPHELVLWAGTPSNPPLVSSAQAGRPHAQRLSPGESLEVALKLDLPLLERGKLRGIDAHAPCVHVSAEQVRLRLDVQPMRKGLQIREYPELGTVDVWGLPPHVLEAVASVEPFVVHRRTDDFHRGGLEG